MERDPLVRGLLLLLVTISLIWLLGWAWQVVSRVSDILLLFFLAWLLKSTVLRYGGFKVYQQLVPFFMGAILGDFVSGGLWGLYGVIHSQQMYMWFPH